MGMDKMNKILDELPNEITNGVRQILSELDNHRKLIGLDISQTMQYLVDQQRTKYSQNEEEKQYDDSHLNKRGFDDRLDSSIKAYIANVDQNNVRKLNKFVDDVMEQLDKRRDIDNKFWIQQSDQKFANLSLKLSDLQTEIQQNRNDADDNDDDGKEPEYGLSDATMNDFHSVPGSPSSDRLESLILSVDESIQSIKPSTFKTTAYTFMGQFVSLFTVFFAYICFIGFHKEQ